MNTLWIDCSCWEQAYYIERSLFLKDRYSHLRSTGYSWRVEYHSNAYWIAVAAMIGWAKENEHRLWIFRKPSWKLAALRRTHNANVLLG